MRRLVTLVLGLALPLFGACGLEQEGLLDPDGGLGGATGSGGSKPGVGTCFPGAKVCPDGSGDVICVEANTPDKGCQKDPACSPCITPHATAKCSADGACEIDTCDAGYQDCNNSAADGCEINTSGDANHCGNCTTDCFAAPGGWICTNGTCEINQCCPGGEPACSTKRDCDGDKTTCEVDIASDPNHCGACGNACNLPHATAGCENQKCTIVTCDPGWKDCDSLPANGCEKDVQTDPLNCGDCNNKCSSVNGAATCQNGSCGIKCQPGWGNCDPNAPGCETDLANTTAHCGGCGQKCELPFATGESCANSKCNLAGCDPGRANCDGAPANGCEINTSTDTAHCGGCSKPCPAPPNGKAVCNNGSCDFSCLNGYHRCGSVCAANNDINNCGQSCAQCPDPGANGNPVCTSGQCGVTCSSGYASCGSATTCYNLANDAQHCGSCPNACTGGRTCQASQCKCPSGKFDCGTAGCQTCCPPEVGCGSSDKCCPGSFKCIHKNSTC